MKWGSSAPRLLATDANLNELPDHEKDALDQLRQSSEQAIVQLSHKLPECDDWRNLGSETHFELRDEILLRFLRHNSLSVDKARLQMEETLKWRASNTVAALSEDICHGMQVGIPIAQLTKANDNGEVLYVGVSEGYTKAQVDHEKQKTGASKLFDFIMYDTNGPKAKYGSIVVDFSNIGLSHIDLYAMKNGILIYLSYFPDIFRKILLINYPRIIHGVWKVISAWLDPRTKSRVIWLENGEQMRDILFESFDKGEVPTWLGGSKQTGDVTLLNGLTFTESDLHKRFRQ